MSTMAEDAITVEAALLPVAPMQMADAEVMQAAKAMQAMTMQPTQRQFIPIEVARRAPAAIPTLAARGQAQPMQPRMPARRTLLHHMPQQHIAVAVRRMAVVAQPMGAVDRMAAVANTTSL